MFDPRPTTILDASAQPTPRHPTKLVLAPGLAVSRTIVPTGNDAEQAPAPLGSEELIPAGCELTVPFPVPPGRIETLPRENPDGVHTVRIEYAVLPRRCR